MLAPNAERQIIPLVLIGAALIIGAIGSHAGIGQVMSAEGARVFALLLGVPGVLLLFLGLGLVYFYRDPDRAPGDGVVSPADGIVMFVEEIDDPDVGRGHRIGVFMSPLDVHVNRVPVAARLEHLEHTSGGYLPAFNKESERNERVTTIWAATEDDAAGGARSGERLKVVQIAGAVARRIDPWVQPGATRSKGERYGMIRLGSRVDTYLPLPLSPAVVAGQRVKAGVSTIARRSGD